MIMRESVSPISFPVNVARLPQRGMPVVIEANEGQRRALAGIHGVDGISALRAELLVAAWKRHGVRVTGKVEARVCQTCVASLEPMENTVEERIDAVFLPEDSKLAREGFGQGGEIIVEAEGDDSPETFSGDWIDVGALAEEFFGLGIDPYPRKAEPSPHPVGMEAAESDQGNLGEKLKAALAGRKR